MLVIIFWLCVSLLFLIYLWYPLSSILIAQLRKKIVPPTIQEFPTVTVIIAAYNEEAVIQQKLENLLKVEYPKDKLRILVASDGSTDRTDEIVESYASQGVELLKCPRKGKTNTLNQALKATTSDIVVFTDAEPLLDKHSLTRLVAHFSNPKVGMVCGNSIYGKGEEFTGSEQESIYWNFENWLKYTESRAYHLIVGGIGDLFAVKRELIDELPTFINHDFITQLMVRSKNHWVIFEPSAFAFSQGSKKLVTEYKRKVRIVFQSAYSLFWMKHFLNPFRYPLMAYQLLVHKILRWLSFLFFFPLLPLSILLFSNSILYEVFTYLLSIFWIIALFGWLASLFKIRIGKFGLPYYFILVTFAALHGFIKSFFVKPKGWWEIVRQTDLATPNQ